MVQHNYDEVWRLSCNTYVCTVSMWYMTCDIFENTTTSSSLFLAFQNTQTFYPAINSRRERSSFASFIFHGNPWKTSWTPVQNNETAGEEQNVIFHEKIWHGTNTFLLRSPRIMVGYWKVWVFWKVQDNLFTVVTFLKFPQSIYRMLNVQMHALHESLQISA